jgi:NADP-dependent 3-hydroxy acid dehydrogenase YdfG
VSCKPARLEGRTALVTGATGAIGAAIVAALDAEGAVVGVVGRRESALRQLVRGTSAGEKGVFVADLTADRDVRSTARAFLRSFGRLDILVHAGGIHLAAPYDSARIADFDRQYVANVRSPYLLTQLLLPAVVESSGEIVFLNSSVVFYPRANVGQFAATQHALRGIADTLRAELNPRGVRVLTLYAGRTATKRQERISREEGRAYASERLLQPDDVAAALLEALTLPRTAELTEIRIRPMLKS